MTDDEIRAEAARRRAEGEQLISRGRQMVEQADAIEAALGGAMSLPVSKTYDTKQGDMTEGQRDAAFARATRMKGGLHPVQEWLQNRPTSTPPRTVEEFAAALGVKPPLVRSWFRAVQRRRIPESLAKKAAAKWKDLPATNAMWPGGIWPGR